MATHIINVSFGLNHYVKTKTREKHSYGQEIVFSNIKLPEVFEVYFSDSPTGKSKTVVGQNNKVLIPDEYFLSGKTIYCYLLVHDTSTDGRMKYVVEIPIEQRPEPTDIGLDPVQQDIATEAIAALQEATARVTDMVEQVSDNLAATEQNVTTTNDNVEQSASNAELARQYAESASGYADTASDYADLAETYKNNTTQIKQQTATISDELKVEIEDAKSVINNKVAIASNHAESASGYAESASDKADLAETYSNAAEQSKQEAETLIEDFRIEIESASSGINRKISDVNTYANNARTSANNAETYAENAQSYSNLAEQTVTDWINEGSGKIVTVAVSGMNPKINAVHNTVYVCGEIISLDFTPCSDGVCDVIFTSGTTPTLLTMPNSVRMPKNFTVLENRTYEINILNGIYGVFTSWV